MGSNPTSGARQEVALGVVTGGYFFVTLSNHNGHMLEIFLLSVIITMLLNSRRSKNRTRKLRGLDAELKELIESNNDSTGIAVEIKHFLLAVIDDNANDRAKFSDDRIAQAQRIIDRAGPSAMYWMTEISAQLAYLAAAQINGLPTNVTDQLKGGATAEQIVHLVVKA